MTLTEDINYLKLVHFLPSSIEPSNIGNNLHQSKLWADTFWRRRKRHSSRSDPEITYLKGLRNSNFTKALEIGSAYGRVTRKISDLEHVKEITGIEICHYFGEYIREYVDEEDDYVTFIFDDFMTTRSLHPQEFDLIILPMNTIGSFPRIFLNQLFERVRQLLRPEGKFLFTTYPESSELKEGGYSGELLVEMGEDPLAIEFFTMEDRINPWGIKSVTYSKYWMLKEDEVLDVAYFKTERNLFHHDYLVEILAENHLTVLSRDQIDHSTVFVCEILDEA